MTLVEKVQSLHEEMRPLIIFEVRGTPCVPAESYDRILRNIDKWSESHLRYMIEQLTHLRNTVWKDIYVVWTRPHINPEMWENYNWMFGSDVLEEQQLLTKARQNFRAAWKVFKQNCKAMIRATKKTDAEEGAGSKDTGSMESLP